MKDVTSIQDKFFRILKERVEQEEFELVVKEGYSNTGQGFIQPLDGFVPISTFRYFFADDYATFNINGHEILAKYVKSRDPRDKTLETAVVEIMEPVIATNIQGK